MRTQPVRVQRVLLVAAGLVLGLVVGGAAVVVADPGASDRAAEPKVKACVTGKKVVRGANADGSCPQGTKAKKIAVKGATGATGPTGPAGPAGLAGPAGVPGATGPQGPGFLTVDKLQPFGGTYQPVHPQAPMLEGYCDAGGNPDVHVRVRGTTTRQVFGLYNGGLSAPATVAMPPAANYDANYDVASSTAHAWHLVAVDSVTGKSQRLDIQVHRLPGGCRFFGQVGLPS